ncbi:hypothetical protein [Flavobacterium muglaense]|uniref:Uncharacterized protein n=1 Tax=Flavobacterium muglaense TaxID=2764716 RepID=A0A923MZ33_9FLAO|nr:hypothetical protein [Flavobacterium muglaense]MBC5837852.1 hypothetical protein [Flavobacterium muglaense]MBC5844321.1 hypothetical protein [Flavobacterium muglaense]
MENLNVLRLQDLNIVEIENIYGGSGGVRGIGKDYLIGKAIDIALEFMFTGWDEYGAYAYKHQASSGGLKW